MKKRQTLWRLRNQRQFLRGRLEHLRLQLEHLGPHDPKIEALIKQVTRLADQNAKDLYKMLDSIAKELYKDLWTVLNDKERFILANTDVFSQNRGIPEASLRRISEGEYLMLVDVNLFRYIFSLTKCILPILKGSGSYYFVDIKLNGLRKSLKAACEVGRYYGVLWQYLALGGTLDGRIQDYSDQDAPASGSFDHHLLAQTVANLEQFIIAHEIAHVLLGNTGQLSKRDEEFEADALALELVLRTTGKHRFLNMPEAAPWRMEGALMLLSFLEFLEKCAKIQLDGSDDQHPSASERIENLAQRRSMDLMFSNDIVRLGLPADTHAFSITPAVRRFLAEAAEFL